MLAMAERLTPAFAAKIGASPSTARRSGWSATASRARRRPASAWSRWTRRSDPTRDRPSPCRPAGLSHGAGRPVANCDIGEAAVRPGRDIEARERLAAVAVPRTPRLRRCAARPCRWAWPRCARPVRAARGPRRRRAEPPRYHRDRRPALAARLVLAPRATRLPEMPSRRRRKSPRTRPDEEPKSRPRRTRARRRRDPNRTRRRRKTSRSRIGRRGRPGRHPRQPARPPDGGGGGADAPASWAAPANSKRR